jgi:16S rRNA (guanine527-N7)-methyltransferase
MRKSENLEITPGQIAALLSPFAVHLSAEQAAQVFEYIRMLMKWNKLVSLTAVVDPAEIVARHFGESMYISSILPVENGRLADVGSGAGFPGLAIKILRPALQVILIESNKKKCAFLAEVATALGLSGVEIIPKRFEEIRSEPGFANFVTARAIGGFPSLLRWTSNSLSDRGHIALWVGSDNSARISNMPGWIWQPAVRIPESLRRFILIGRPRP